MQALQHAQLQRMPSMTKRQKLQVAYKKQHCSIDMPFPCKLERLLSRLQGQGLTCTEPSAATSSFLRSALHMPSLVRSMSRCWFTTVNSPLSTRRTYMLLVYGSKHSLLPRICTGAGTSEFGAAGGQASYCSVILFWT